jgi:transcriptional regulator with XRE-family HTH domain
MASDFLQGVGRAVRRRRRERGMTQGDLADRLGLARTSVTNLEKGEQNPPLSILPQLAHALGAEPEELIAEAMGRGDHSLHPLETQVADVELRRWAANVIQGQAPVT